MSVFIKIAKDISEKNKNIKFDCKLNKFIKLIFSSKRKTLYNNIKSKYSKNQLTNLYKNLSLNKNVRAEEMSFNEIEQIYKYMNK